MLLLYQVVACHKGDKSEEDAGEEIGCYQTIVAFLQHGDILAHECGKVVKPPQNPVMRMRRMDGVSHLPSKLKAEKSPIRKQPIIFTVNVPIGVDCPMSIFISWETP